MSRGYTLQMGTSARHVPKGPRRRFTRHLDRLRQSEKVQNRRRNVINRNDMTAPRGGDVRAIGDEDSRIAMIGECRAGALVCSLILRHSL